MKTVTWDCRNCKKTSTASLEPPAPLICSHCAAECGVVPSNGFHFHHCPLCPCSQFYLVKDFNQALGCLVMLVGIVFVPVTYGLSLPVMALIDWLLYKKISSMAVCYRCGAEFRGFKKLPEHFRPFLHHIGEKYDRYRK